MTRHWQRWRITLIKDPGRRRITKSPPAYSGHSPGPHPPNFYPYPLQYHHHAPSPPRGHHPRGSYGSRGYYQQQQAPYAVHYPAKYSPLSHHYPSSNAPVLPRSGWQQQRRQPISLLPKRLLMPVPITPQEPLTKSETPPPPPPQTSSNISVSAEATLVVATTSTAPTPSRIYTCSSASSGCSFHIHGYASNTTSSCFQKIPGFPPLPLHLFFGFCICWSIA